MGSLFIGWERLLAISRRLQWLPLFVARLTVGVEFVSTGWGNGREHRVDYEPGESSSGLFGGNSNWRGPIWFPLNFLIIESLQKFDFYWGESFKVEMPTGSGRFVSLAEAAGELSRRLVRIFLSNAAVRRPVFGRNAKMHCDPHFKDLVPFHEYFHGENGSGVGASHQTGWTALVAKLIQQSGE